MKQCPVCQSLAFDDAKTCFGCMHDYSSDNAGFVERSLIPPADFALEGEGGYEPLASNASAFEAPQSSDSPEAPPSFVIQIKPERERSGLTSWTCTVDLVPA